MSVTMAQAIIHGPTDITINLQYDSGTAVQDYTKQPGRLRQNHPITRQIITIT